MIAAYSTSKHETLTTFSRASYKQIQYDRNKTLFTAVVH